MASLVHGFMALPSAAAACRPAACLMAARMRV